MFTFLIYGNQIKIIFIYQLTKTSFHGGSFLLVWKYIKVYLALVSSTNGGIRDKTFHLCEGNWCYV